MAEETGIEPRRLRDLLSGSGVSWRQLLIRLQMVFPGELARELQDNRKQQLQDKLRAGQRWQNVDLVFHEVGQTLRRRSLVMWFKRFTPGGTPKVIRIYGCAVSLGACKGFAETIKGEGVKSGEFAVVLE